MIALLPLNTIRMELTNQRLLVVAPHPDDEVLGCGGLIKKIKTAGGQIYVQYLTVGATRDFSAKGVSSIDERQQEVKKVAEFFKFDEYHLGFTGDEFHLKLDAHGQMQVIELIERDSPVSLERIKPTMVAFPSLYSYNQDHQLAARATHAALRPAESSTKHFVKTAIAYEVPADGWSMHHQIVPNFFVPLTESELEAKKKAMSLYASQMRPAPNPRSLPVIESLARLRGAFVSSEYAEAYILYRGVI